MPKDDFEHVNILIHLKAPFISLNILKCLKAPFSSLAHLATWRGGTGDRIFLF